MNTVRKFAAHAAKVLFAVAAGALVSFAPAAYAVTYSTSGLSQPLTSLGDALNTQFDILAVGGVAGDFVDGQTINLNSLSFTAGINATVPKDYTNVYSIVENITINGGDPHQLTIPFNLSISYSDTLTILGTTVSFLDGGSLWQVAVNELTLPPNPGGTITGWLTAQVTDPPTGAPQTPLPAALPLFASGLGGMGLFGWWRKRKDKRAAAAAVAAV